MAQTSWPYAGDSVEEPEWISMSRLWRGSGVIDGADAELEVTEVTGQLQVSVATGEAWLEGFYYANDTAEVLNLDTADLNDDRIDLVVVRSDRTAGTARLAVITGTPAAAPVAPTVTQDHDVAGVFEIALAEVRVGAAASNVDGQVTDRRSFSLKPAAVSDTAPADPAVDQLWYDSSVDLLKRWTGTTWVAAGNAAYIGQGDAGVLATVRYAPAIGSVTAYSTTSTAPVAIDTTNLVITFTIPSSGKVVLWVTGAFLGSSGAISLSLLNLSAGSSSRTMVFANGESSAFVRKTVPIVLTGMTPGASETVHLAWWTNESNGTAEMKIDETSGAADDFGPAHLIVEAA